MNLDQAVARYIELSDDEKVALLGRIAFDLTVEFRDIVRKYSTEAEKLERLYGISELQHTLLGQLLAHQSRTAARYEDREFFLLIIRKAKGNGLLSRLQQSILQQLTGSVIS